MNENIKRILDSIERVAPGAWKSAVNYVQIDAANTIVASLLFALIFLTIGVLSYKNSLLKEIYDRDVLQIIYFVSFLVSIVALLIALSWVPVYINPEGYMIMRMFRGQ